MSIKNLSDIEQDLWKSVYLERLSKCDQSKDERIIKSYSKMAASFADEFIYYFRARVANHAKVIGVVHGTNDKDFENNHAISLRSCQCASDDN